MTGRFIHLWPNWSGHLASICTSPSAETDTVSINDSDVDLTVPAGSNCLRLSCLGIRPEDVSLDPNGKFIR